MSIQNLSGRLLGQYALRELLGVGGMGAVYRAEQKSLRRAVAVKVLSAQLVQQPGYLERFNREAETAAALEHRHIIPIYDYGMQLGVSYVVMRLLTGGTLADRLALHTEQSRALPSLGEISKVLEQLASALDYAHSRGVIHRDIKPSNVMFDNQGSAFLVDFGIAKLMEATHALTGTGATMGTPSYMPPEQWRAEVLTPEADQYALGVVVYSLVAGRVPFEAPTPYGLMHKHLNEMPTPPQVLRPDVPEAVAQVINRAMAKTAAERFPTCAAFAQAFDGAIRGNTGEVTNFFAGSIPPRTQVTSRAFVPEAASLPGTLPARKPRPTYASPLVVGAALVVMIVLAGIGFLVLRGGDGNESGASGKATVTNTAPSIIVILETLTDSAPSAEPVMTQVEQAVTPTTPAPSETASPIPSATVPPTTTPVPSHTPDLEGTTNAMLAARLTQTAELWTDTPTPDLEGTVIAAMTGTAARWTVTPSPTSTPTLTPTATSTPTTAPTFTLIPSPTASYTPLPRPTNTVVPLRPSNTPVPYLHVGGQARVYVEDEGLKLRAGPGTGYEILENLPRGTIVTLIGEPAFAQGLTWWRVRSPIGWEGWAVESADGLQTLIPLPDY